MKKFAYLTILIIPILFLLIFYAGKITLKTTGIPAVQADDDEEDGDERRAANNSAPTSKPTTTTQTETVILKDSDGDGILDNEDPHPDTAEIYIAKDENQNGIVDKFEQ